MEVRWPDGWECPRCGCATCSPVARRNRIWQCTRCSHQFSVTVGTATRHSKARLRRWFHAMWLLARSKRGVSALELAAPRSRASISSSKHGFIHFLTPSGSVPSSQERISRTIAASSEH